MYTKYCVGFAYDENYDVALIRKNHPEWQAGLLNGIGGHVDEGERPWEAMTREFLEETGVEIRTWDRICTLIHPNASIYVYKAKISSEKLAQVQSMTDEKVSVLQKCVFDNLHSSMLPNLPWLLSLALYEDASYEPFNVHVITSEKGSPG